jgi:hypothetical protein
MLEVYVYSGDPIFVHTTKIMEIEVVSGDAFAKMDDNKMKVNGLTISDYQLDELSKLIASSQYVNTMTEVMYNTMVEEMLNAKHGNIGNTVVHESDYTLTNTDDLILRGVRFKKL